MEIKERLLKIIKDENYRPKTIDGIYTDLITEGVDFVEFFGAFFFGVISFYNCVSAIYLFNMSIKFTKRLLLRNKIFLRFSKY